MYSLEEVMNVDAEVAQAIVDEQNRQNSHIELIASENWVSKAVMAAMGSPLTNKYAEGYPAKRYYGGCDCVDVVETREFVTPYSSKYLESLKNRLIFLSNFKK